MRRRPTGWLAFVVYAACTDSVREVDDASRDAAAARDVAAADARPSPTDAPAGEPLPKPDTSLLCDGSDDVRIGVQLHNAPGSDPFTQPFGNAFAFIDGKCRYYASTNYMTGVATGQLTESEGEQIADDLGWSMIAVWASPARSLTVYPGPGQCFDGGSTSITKRGYAIRCQCFCAEEADHDTAAEALSGAYDFIETMTGRGTPLAGAVRAQAQGPLDAEWNARAFDWPLDRPIASIPGLIYETNQPNGAVLEDATEAMLLRELRAAGFEQDPTRGRNPTALSTAVVDADAVYAIEIVDELPEGIPESIEALRASLVGD